MLLLLFLYNLLIPSDFCSDCTNLVPTAELVILAGIATIEAKVEIEMQPKKLKRASVQHNLNTYVASYIFIICFISSKR